MECSGRRTLNELSVEKPDQSIYQKVMKNWDAIAKPLDGMGRFETLTAQIGAILGTDEIDISKKAVIIMCADNGVVEEGISQSDQCVTKAVARQMGRGTSSVGKMAAIISAKTIPVDIGMNQNQQIAGVLNKKIRCGTRNFRKEPAMTKEEAIAAILTGVDLVKDCKKNGYQILATGEMGIGNTTTSSAVASVLMDKPVEDVTGKGAGLTTEGLERKIQVIKNAVNRHQPDPKDPVDVLSKVGGLDLAGLTGVYLGGAACRMPVVIDGFISGVAALLAVKLCPQAGDYIIASHVSKEPAGAMVLEAVGKEPSLMCDMCLGEGTGAVALFPLLDMSLHIYKKMSTFSQIEIDDYVPLE